MKKYLLAATVLLLSVSAFAGVKNATPKGNWNPITIYNQTNKDIAYIMAGVYGGAVYGIQANNVDIYHSGTGDEFALFEVGVCHNLPSNGGGCPDNENVQPCTISHYNANLIKSIEIDSLKSCKVTCLDGGTTSCQQSG